MVHTHLAHRALRQGPVRRHTTALRLSVTVLLAGAVVLGCGSEEEPGADDPVGASPSSQPDPSSPSTTGPADPGEAADPSAPGKPGGSVTVTGTITPGAEAGCVLLAGTPYLLLPGAGGSGLDQLEDGTEVEVTGVADPGLMTTCQQGTPLEVTSVEPVAD